MFRSFKDSATERLWSWQRVKSIDQHIERTALRKLVMLDAAEILDDLRATGSKHSAETGPTDVEIVDYH